MQTETPPLKVPDPPVLLTYKEAARLLTVSQRTLRGWVLAGRIKEIRLGGAVRFHRDELDRVVREGIR